MVVWPLYFGRCHGILLAPHTGHASFGYSCRTYAAPSVGNLPVERMGPTSRVRVPDGPAWFDYRIWSGSGQRATRLMQGDFHVPLAPFPLPSLIEGYAVCLPSTSPYVMRDATDRATVGKGTHSCEHRISPGRWQRPDSVE